MSEPWKDIRKKVMMLKEADRTGANLAPTDFDIIALLDDADALLKAVLGHLDDLQLQFDMGQANTQYPSFNEFLLDQYPELAALPEHLRRAGEDGWLLSDRHRAGHG